MRNQEMELPPEYIRVYGSEKQKDIVFIWAKSKSQKGLVRGQNRFYRFAMCEHSK